MSLSTATAAPAVPGGKGPDGLPALREAERLLDSLPIILIGLCPQLRVTRWNRTAGTVLGASAAQVIGNPLAEAAIRWDWERVRRGIDLCRSQGESIRLDELAYVRADGTDGMLGLTLHRLIGEAGAAGGLTVIGADITERKQLERQLAQSQKLRSIGQLASGIAHEINTPTQYVGDNTRFLQEAFAELMEVLGAYAGLLADARSGGFCPDRVRALDEALRRADLDYLAAEIPAAVRHTLEGVERIAKIVRAMKEFAHPGREEKVTADLNRIIETTLTVARNEWKYVADVVTDLDPGLPPLFCHPGEINQVVLNLVVNAAHAIEEALGPQAVGKGVITVTTRRCNGWAQVRVQDTGAGIPAAVQPRIFEPFFTTKPVGRGSGQGLAICHPVIVAKHGGRIYFESEAGRGTTFTIELPLAEAGEAA
ncbi:MAG: ATP-binding protein [Desulfobacterales bacterium]